MVKPRTWASSLFPKTGRSLVFFLLLIFLSLGAWSARAAIQFDVFPGFDTVIPEASWFPIVCEVKNDGPPFMGVIEVAPGQFNEGQTRRVMVELPTGTLKRITIPVFSSARYQSAWDVRLLDERGRARDEKLNIPHRTLAASATLVGALPRTATGVPIFRVPLNQDAQMQPVAARIQSQLLPDNPLVYEGLSAIYLNSEKAADLNEHQVFALMAWLNQGGHLILGIEQIGDVNAVPWLKNLVPCDLADMRTVSSHVELQNWLRGNPVVASQTETNAATTTSKKKLRPKLSAARHRNSNYNPYNDVAEDPEFEKADMQVVTGRLREATVLASGDGLPLMVESRQGRGRVTTLMFSPERKPFSTWKNLPSFWSKLTDVMPEIYDPSANNNNYAYNTSYSIDGVFGAMIDSKQVRKLPVEWLLLLLIAYLVVIGPLDRYWLKRINRPMLTWITFPCYVVMFSLLIYFIGYKLRAGDTEWNELHLVDVLQEGQGAELRGHTYTSIYSPVNATYRVETQQRFASFRGEFQSRWNGGGQGGERAEVFQTGDNFKADIYVPVWTSQLYASDWWQQSSLPLRVEVSSDGSAWSVNVTNQRGHALANARLVVGGRILELGELPAGQGKTFKFTKEQGMLVRDFVATRASGYQNAAASRQNAFGASGGGHIDDLPDASMVVSFISNLQNDQFVTPPGLDLSPVMDRGEAILLAWEANYSPINPMNQFPARRSHVNTLWRLAVPVNFISTP